MEWSLKKGRWRRRWRWVEGWWRGKKGQRPKRGILLDFVERASNYGCLRGNSGLNRIEGSFA